MHVSLSSGTLLGLYKYRDVIDWDGDGDISVIYGTGYQSIMTKEMKSQGINANMLQVRYKNASVDIVRWKGKAETLRGHELEKLQKYYPEHVMKNEYMIVKEFHKLDGIPQGWIFPRKTMKLGVVNCAIPNEPEKVLAYRYPWTYRWNLKVPYKWKCYIPFL